MRRSINWLCLATMLALGGCNRSDRSVTRSYSAKNELKQVNGDFVTDSSRSMQRADAGGNSPVEFRQGSFNAGSEKTAISSAASGLLAVAGNVGDNGALAAIVPAADRKIIYVAEVSLVVEDFSQTEKELPKLVEQVGGYLADVSVERASGAQRAGRWSVRVPVERFNEFLDSLSKLGVPESRRQTAQDVSEEYVDLEARIKNSKRLEDRLLKLVDERTGNIKDVTEVEQQLARVREEIERMEGRLRYLANRTALTTVTITAREEKDYRPPETPAFATRLGQNWSDSLSTVSVSGQNFLLGAVYAAPWLLICGVVLSPAMVFVRRKLRRQKS